MTRTDVRRRRRTLLILTVVLTAALAGPVGHAAMGSSSGGVTGAGAAVQPPSEAASTIHVVREGETLWSIAEAAAPGNDPRQLVDAIADLNGIEDGSIVPGQAIEIPTT